MMKLLLGGMALALLGGSALLWMLRPGRRPAEGSAAPDFALQDQDGRIHRLGDYAGRWVVLYFYPRDNTPLCTREACHFRDDAGAIGELGAAILGISLDTPRSHADFAHRHGLPFPLLSDPGGKTAAAFGSLLNLGLLRVARRKTFIIGPDGRIAARFDRVDTARHSAEVKRVLETLRRATS